MDVVGDLTIDGPGPKLLTIEGDGTITGLFRLNRSADVQNRLVLRGATVRSFRFLDGGAIEGYGATGPEPLESVIEVDGCVFEENGWASGDPNAQGGAISASGALTIRRSEFVGTTTGGSGGGAVQSSGSLLVEDSLFWGNSAESDGGGAIRILGTGAVTRRIVNSTFSDNHVTVDSANNDGGGAIAFVGLGAGTGLQVYNCTFAGNTTVQGGGGARSGSRARPPRASPASRSAAASSRGTRRAARRTTFPRPRTRASRPTTASSRRTRAPRRPGSTAPSRASSVSTRFSLRSSTSAARRGHGGPGSAYRPSTPGRTPSASPGISAGGDSRASSAARPTSAPTRRAPRTCSP